MSSKYKAKCGHVLPGGLKSKAQTLTVTLKTDRPFVGEDKPIVPPSECDPKCLNSRRTAKMFQMEGNEMVMIVCWNCRFTRIDT